MEGQIGEKKIENERSGGTDRREKIENERSGGTDRGSVLARIWIFSKKGVIEIF